MRYYVEIQERGYHLNSDNNLDFYGAKNRTIVRTFLDESSALTFVEDYKSDIEKYEDILEIPGKIDADFFIRRSDAKDFGRVFKAVKILCKPVPEDKELFFILEVGSTSLDLKAFTDKCLTPAAFLEFIQGKNPFAEIITLDGYRVRANNHTYCMIAVDKKIGDSAKAVFRGTDHNNTIWFDSFQDNSFDKAELLKMVMKQHPDWKEKKFERISDYGCNYAYSEFYSVLDLCDAEVF